MKRFVAIIFCMMLVCLSSFPSMSRAEEATESFILYAWENYPAQKLMAKKNQRYAVYSAPDEEAYRAANGKASVSTNGEIFVFGKTVDWLLIQYAIDAKRTRIGYIKAPDLAANADIPELDFTEQKMMVVDSAYLTDNLFDSSDILTMLPAGETVIQLGTLGEKAYVEYNRMRGFMVSYALSEHSFYFPEDEKGRYNLFSVDKLLEDDRHHVYAVTGRFLRTYIGEECMEFEMEENGTKYVMFRLADDFYADMPNSASDESLETVSDLYDWYVRWYERTNGKEPENGQLISYYDTDTEDDEKAEKVNFWGFDARMELNEQGEIIYLEYVFVPWG